MGLTSSSSPYSKFKSTKKIYFQPIFIICALFLVTIIILFFASIGGSVFNYKYGTRYYLLSLYRFREDFLAEHFVKVARDVDGAGYEFLEGDVTHVVAFVFFDEEKFNAAKSRFSSFDVSSVELRAERVKVSRRGKESVFYDDLTTLPKSIKEVVSLYAKGEDFEKAFKKLSFILNSISYEKSILEAEPTIDEDRKRMYLSAFSSQIDALESTLNKISNNLKVLSKLNYLLVEAAVNDVNFRKMLT